MDTKWRFTASNILGAVGLPMTIPGILVWMKIADGVLAHGFSISIFA